MSPRRPVRAAQSSPIPSLALWLAGAVAGCHDPECTTDRIGELDAHGAEASSRLRRADLRGAAREVALATGVMAHPPSPAVQVVPPNEVHPQGGVQPVQPEPVPPPPPPAVDHPRTRTGGVRRPVHLTPPTPPAPPPPVTTPRARLGDVAAVGVNPASRRSA